MSKQEKGMLRIPWADPITLDPTLAGDVLSNVILSQLFAGLTKWNEKKETVPNVAHKWDASEDRHKYVFHLRSDVNWSDGVPVTAGDFECAWKRVLDPDTGPQHPQWAYYIKNAQAFHEGKATWEQVGVRALDDVSLAIELEGPTAYFLDWLARPIPKHIVEEKGAGWTQVENIVTNGPYRLESWTPGKTIVLSRNPEYHGVFPGNVERVEFHLLGFMPEARVKSLAMYESGDLDIWWVNMPEGDKALQEHAAEHITRPWASTQYLWLDTSRAPFDNVQVRRAFAMATDRETLAREALRGMVTPATGGLVPPAVPGHAAGIALPYDPDQARQLMAEAGYPGGRGFPEVDAVGGDVEGEYLRKQWRDILGVDIQWEDLEFAAFLERVDSAPPQIAMAGWASEGDPDSYLRLCVGRARHNWEDDTYTELVQKARYLADQDERMALYGRADKILMEGAAIVPLTYSQSHLLVKPWVKLSETLFLNFKYARIEPH